MRSKVHMPNFTLPFFLPIMLSFSWQIDSLHRARPVVSRVTGTEQGHVSQARGQFILQDIHKVHFRNVRRIYFISGFQFNEFNHDFDANNACPEFQDVVFWAGFDCLSLLPLFTFFQDFALWPSNDHNTKYYTFWSWFWSFDVAKYSDEMIQIDIFFCHGVKYRVLVREQWMRRVELPDESLIHHHYLVVVKNGAECWVCAQ